MGICTCTRVASHTETETVGVTAQITLQPTCTQRGKTTYTSEEFENEEFSAQTATHTNIPALGHTWAVVNSVAADSEDGLRGGIVCSVCDQVQVESRLVSAQKILRIPDMMDTIDDEAFFGTAAEQVIISSRATKLGSRAFANCENLLIVVIPSSVTSFGEDLFLNSDVAVICPDNSPAATWCDEHSIPHNP